MFSERGNVLDYTIVYWKYENQLNDLIRDNNNSENS